VISLRLDKDGRKVDKVMPLDAANAAFGLPTYGAIDGDGLYFIANSQKNAYDAYGVVKDASQLGEVNVFRSDLRFAWDGSVGKRTMPIPVGTPAMRPGAPRTSTFDNVQGGAQSTQPSGG